METYEGFVAKMAGEVKHDTLATTNKTQDEDGKDTLMSSKQLWRTISGKYYKVTKSLVSKKLDEASLMIRQGMDFYKPPNPSTDVEMQKEIAPRIYQILFKLRTFLRLDIKITFKLLQHYLIHIFRGERKELMKYLETEENTELFMLDFAAFYWSERIHLLQCINIIVTHCGNKKHPLSGCYTDLIEKMPDDILELMFSQLTSALNVFTPTLLTHGELMVPAQQQQWYQNYLHELMQIINNLFFCLKGYQTSSLNLLKTLQLCMKNDFGKVLPVGCEKYPALIENICYLEVMLVLLATGLHTEDLFKLLSNSDALDEVNRIVSAMDQRGAHGVIVMGWAFIKNIIADDDEQKTLAESNLENLYGNFDDVCSFLSQLLSNPIFQEPTELSSIAHDLIYKLLHWIIHHNIRDGLDSQPLYKCVTTALVHPEFKKHFWTEDQDRGLHILLIEASRKFPVDFLSFSSLIELLSRDEHSIVSNLVKYLRTLPNFAERLTPNMKDVLIKEMDDNTNICTKAHHPLYSNIVIPFGTTGNFSTNDNKLIVWDYTFSFFDIILGEIKTLYNEISYGVQNLQPKTVANLTVSMKILANIVHSGFIVDGDMVLPVEAALELMAKFTDVLEPPNQLLANCLDIVTYLWMDYRDEMYFKLDTIKFLPHVNSLNISPISCINGKFHCGGSLGPIVVVQEFSSAEYPLLKSFLQFVQVLLEFDPETVTKFEKVGNDYSDKLKYTIEKNFKLLLPAMSYILFEVFPTYNNWRYKKDEDHSFISRSCLSIFHKLISIDTRKDIINYLTPGEVLHLMCFYNLLEGGATFPLLKIVGTGNGTLQLLMESQLNWDTGPGVDFINLVRLAMALLNMTLRLKTTKDMDYLCPLEAKIMYYPNDKNHLRILHSTVDYIYHTFNPNLPTLAVELMRSFAMDLPVSLITCLGVDPEILRHCFIRHLESSEEPTHIKVAIFNFLNACVLKQSGLAEMLINIECPTEIPRDFPNPQITSGKQGGCLLYACELLANLEEYPKIAYGSVYNAVMKLLHTLWLHRKELALKFLRRSDNFWINFCSPLLQNPFYGTEAYIHMFDLLALEIYFKSGKLDNLLTLCLKNFFKESHKTLEMWTLFVTTSLKEAKKEMRYPDNASKIATKVMTSFKDFITIIITYMPDLITRNEVVFLMKNFFNALTLECQDFTNPFAIIAMSEICFELIKKWRSDSFAFEERKAACEQICHLLISSAEFYKGLDVCTKQALFTFMLQSIITLEHDLRKDMVLSYTALGTCLDLVLFEVTSITPLEREIKLPENNLYSLSMKKYCFTQEKSEFEKKPIPSLLSTQLLLCFLKLLEDTPGWQQHFKKSKAINQIMGSLKVLVKVPAHFEFTVQCMEVLLFIANSSLSSMFIDSYALMGVWLAALPPFTFEGWLKTDWIKMYRPTLNIATILLNKHEDMFLDHAISFLTLHSEDILSMVVISQCTVDVNQLAMSVTALMFLREITKYIKAWKYRSKYLEEISNFIVKSVITCINRLVAMLNNPSYVKDALENRGKCSTNTKDKSYANEKFIAVMNMCLKTIYMCFGVLLPLSPKIEHMVSLSQESLKFWQPLVDATFANPILTNRAQPILTFGALISIVNVCIHMLNKSTQTHSHIKAFSSPTSPFTSPDIKWTSKLDKQLTPALLEMCVTFLVEQGTLHLNSSQMCLAEKISFKQQLASEMVNYHLYCKRYKIISEQSQKTPVSKTLNFSLEEFGLSPSSPLSSELSPKKSVVRSLNFSSEESTFPSTSTPIETTEPKCYENIFEHSPKNLIDSSLNISSEESSRSSPMFNKCYENISEQSQKNSVVRHIDFSSVESSPTAPMLNKCYENISEQSQKNSVVRHIDFSSVESSPTAPMLNKCYENISEQSQKNSVVRHIDFSSVESSPTAPMLNKCYENISEQSQKNSVVRHIDFSSVESSPNAPMLNKCYENISEQSQKNSVVRHIDFSSVESSPTAPILNKCYENISEQSQKNSDVRHIDFSSVESSPDVKMITITSSPALSELAIWMDSQDVVMTSPQSPILSPLLRSCPSQYLRLLDHITTSIFLK